MTEFLLLPGAGGDAWYWHLVVQELRNHGHIAVPVDLPGDDDAAGLPDYAAIAVRSAKDLTEIVMVAQSLGAFTAAIAAARLPIRAVVLVNAMIPRPGESPGAWFENTGAEEARVAARDGRDPGEDFTHDLRAEVVSELVTRTRGQSASIFASPCDFDGWPPVPVHAVTGADDRFFPPEFQRRLCRDRLGTDPVVLPGGHAIALAQPVALAHCLLRLAGSQPHAMRG